MRKILQIVSVILVATIIIESAVGIYVYNATVHAVKEDRRPLDIKVGMLEKKGFDVEAFEEKYNVREVLIKSSFGDHVIPANYLTVKDSCGAVVMAHGLNGNRITAYPVARMFLENGYNVLTYDQRNSGENEAVYMTCGLWESNDFRDCVEYICGLENQGAVGAWGSSIGGATVGFYLGSEHASANLDFAIMDCPVSNMEQIVEHFLTRKHNWIPGGLRTELGSLVTELCLGYNYGDGDVCQYVSATTVPLLIFNTKKDGVTPYNMGADLAKAAGAQLVTVKDSGHTDIYWDHPKMYEETMMEFIERNK